MRLFCYLASLFVIFTAVLSCYAQVDQPVLADRTGDSVNFTVLLDNTLTVYQRNAARLAGEKWQTAVGGSVELKFFDADPTDLLREDVVEGVIGVVKQTTPTGTVGLCSWTPRGRWAFIRMHPALSSDDFRSVFVHELGHAFHLDHWNGTDPAIMFPTAWITMDNVQCRDVVNFCEEWKNCVPKCLVR